MLIGWEALQKVQWTTKCHQLRDNLILKFPIRLFLGITFTHLYMSVWGSINEIKCLVPYCSSSVKKNKNFSWSLQQIIHWNSVFSNHCQYPSSSEQCSVVPSLNTELLTSTIYLNNRENGGVHVPIVRVPKDIFVKWSK